MSNIIFRANEIIKYKQDLEEKNWRSFPLPHFVDFHTSYTCNQKCNGCAYSSLHNGKIMSKENHFALVELLISKGVKFFDFAGGGEPTMLPYLHELLKLIRMNGCYFGLITNGTNIINNGQEFVDFLSKNATYVRISLEASNAATYCNYKKVGIADWVDALLAAEELAKRMEDFTLKFSVGKSLRGVTHYLSALVLADELKVKQVTFKALRHEPEELSLKEKIYEDSILSKLPFGKLKVKKWIKPFGEIPQCWLTPIHTVFDYFGNMYVCCYYYNRDGMKLGNIFEADFDKLWFSEHHYNCIKKIRRRDCATVDCKFFYHHENFERLYNNGGLYLV